MLAMVISIEGLAGFRLRTPRLMATPCGNDRAIRGTMPHPLLGLRVLLLAS
jgi:hypothetical protein